MSDFHIRHPDGSMYGPYTVAELRKYAKDGRITAATEICRVGTTKWVKANQVRGLGEFEPSGIPASGDAGVPVEPAKGTPEPIVAETAFADKELHEPDLPRKRAPSTSPDKQLPIGVVDRLLRAAFQWARSVSVAVIALCAVASICAVALGVYAIMPQTPNFSNSCPTPTMGEFSAAWAVDSENQRNNRPESEAGDETSLGSIDPCEAHRARVVSVVKKLKLDEQAVYVICQKVVALPEGCREPFVSGFVDFSSSFAAAAPTNESCTAADAANWYIKTFESGVLKAQFEANQRELAAAKRRELLQPALSTVGFAFVGLLSFLLLPLLIQIERNTRLQPALTH